MSASNIDTLPAEIIGLILNHLEPVIPTEVNELTVIDTRPYFKAFSLTNKVSIPIYLPFSPAEVFPRPAVSQL